tara:strand:+ start:537 stop:707 length:171 start_codon:yes stop_codon:yes gene_type:complete
MALHTEQDKEKLAHEIADRLQDGHPSASDLVSAATIIRQLYRDRDTARTNDFLNAS